MAKRKLKPKAKITILTISAVIAVLLIVGSVILISEYRYRFSEAVLRDGNLKIYPNTTLSDIAQRLESEDFIASADKMIALAQRHDRDSIQAGNYRLVGGDSYRTLLNAVSLGRQTPVRLTFNNIRTLDRLAGAVSRYTMIDSATFADHLLSDSVAAEFEFTPKTFISMFLPNTYEVYWTITPTEFTSKMKSEYDRFWSISRQAKAEELGLTRLEVSILASIVIQETKKKQEMSDVAGVYINRIRKGMPLQADPTVKFAIGDFALKRILFKHLKADSPYNTYKHTGLPPGPICMPEVVALDAVLDYRGHDYYYFCASPEMNGLHVFARNLSEHNRNAAAYHRKLNR